jgi:hypothetical protein
MFNEKNLRNSRIKHLGFVRTPIKFRSIKMILFLNIGILIKERV